ncbi:hypothetical protein HDU80_007643 [Chytriomyces hyalinus]|nr:hypothetical protein HDU80_007643 [Chytriomyces hyalinus]
MSSSAHSAQSQSDAHIEPPPIPAFHPLSESDSNSDSEDWENILRIKVDLNSVSAQIFVEDSLVTWNSFVAKVIDLYRLPANCEITASYATSDDGARVLIHTDAHLAALQTLDPIPRLSIHVSSNNDSPTLNNNNSNTDTLPLKLSRIDSEPVSVASLLLDLEGRVDIVHGGLGGDQRIPETTAAVADTMEFGGLKVVLDERAPVPELDLKGTRIEEEEENVGLKLGNDESVWRKSRRDEGGDDGRECPSGFEEVLFAVVIALFAWWMLR